MSPGNVVVPNKAAHDRPVFDGYLISEPLNRSRLQRVSKGVDLFRQQTGGEIRLPRLGVSDCFVVDVAGERSDCFMNLLLNSDSDGVISLWGGKSCLDLLFHLRYLEIRKARKIILGFSDNCVILNAIFSCSGLVTFYGPNVVGKLDQVTQPNWALVTSDLKGDVIIYGKPDYCTVSGSFSGRIVGGNLSTFVIGLSGTPFLPINGKRIFFWECTETVQIQAQLLTALKNQGFFDEVELMIIGFSPTVSSPWATDQLEMLEYVFGTMRVPTVRLPIFGHSSLSNPIFPVGGLVSVDASAKDVSMKLLESVVC